jgi:sortase A
VKKSVVPWLRRAEIAFFVIGLSLLGGALAATLNTWLYQTRQERAFSDIERKVAPPGDADPLVLGRIEIPRIGVSAILREGDDDATLAVAVGHIPGTAGPGESGNIALAGHRDSFFRALRGIRRHDSIWIHTPRLREEYQVDSTEVVGPGETKVLEPTGNAVLTLVTCYPFKWIGHAPNRFIVRASRVASNALVR